MKKENREMVVMKSFIYFFYKRELVDRLNIDER